MYKWGKLMKALLLERALKSKWNTKNTAFIFKILKEWISVLLLLWLTSHLYLWCSIFTSVIRTDEAPSDAQSNPIRKTKPGLAGPSSQLSSPVPRPHLSPRSTDQQTQLSPRSLPGNLSLSPDGSTPARRLWCCSRHISDDIKTLGHFFSFAVSLI